MMTGDLREGVTTGSCAAGAALASALWQLQGRCPDRVEIETPAGRRLCLDICSLEGGTCGVIKDAGDDPDVTDGCMVVALVEIRDEKGIIFRAGEGIGTVTSPGLKVPVGEPAINPVPRQMIAAALAPVLGERGACVTLSIPGGEALAKRTFNERVGVVGGLSILGTSGIVRPMSEEAVKESLVLEMNVRVCQGVRRVAFVLGAAGEKAVKARFGEDICCIQISNYIGFMLDEAVRLGVTHILVAGFAGKLVKVAADIMNTHSHVADGRREVLCTFAALGGAPQPIIEAIYGCRTVQGAIDVIAHYGYDGIWPRIAETAAQKCMLRTGGAVEVAVVLLDKDQNILGQSQGTDIFYKAEVED